MVFFEHVVFCSSPVNIFQLYGVLRGDIWGPALTTIQVVQLELARSSPARPSQQVDIIPTNWITHFPKRFVICFMYGKDPGLMFLLVDSKSTQLQYLHTYLLCGSLPGPCQWQLWYDAV